MKMITDVDLTNKKVLIRCDLNVPIKNGIILDDNRIKYTNTEVCYEWIFSTGYYS